jgi:GNAT superfamily N-acetyltransferase
MNSTQVSANDYIYYCEEQKLYLRYGNKNSKHSKDLLIKSLTSELYVKGWALECVLLRHLAGEEPKDFNIVLVSTNLSKNFIGLLFTQYLDENKTGTMYFVKDEYRRKGIASMMIEFCKFKNLPIGLGMEGIDGSELFFKKHNIDFLNW